jgi:hypothetical protein
VPIIMGGEMTALGKLVLAEMQKPEVMDKLRKRAMKLSFGHKRDAQDLLGKSLSRVIDENDDPYRPDQCAFLPHMFVNMRQTRYRLHRSAQTEAQALASGLTEGLSGGQEAPQDEVVGSMRSLAVLRMLGERVLEALGSDLLARQIYETALVEDLDPAREAARFERTPAEIKAAHDRLRYHAKKVLDEWRASEERRMNAKRASLTLQSEEETP